MANSNQDGAAKNQDLSMQQKNTDEKPRTFMRRLKPYNCNKTEFSDGELDLISLSVSSSYVEFLSETPLVNHSSLILHEKNLSFFTNLQSTGTGVGGFEVGESSQSPPQGVGDGEAVSVSVSPPPAPSWAAESAAKNGSLRHALQILKSESRLFENTALITQGSNNCVVANPVYVPVVTSGAITKGKSTMHVETQLENPAKKAKYCCNNEMCDSSRNLKKSMPSVTTTGGDPNGKKVGRFSS